MSSEQPFYKEVFHIPESGCKDIEKELEKIDFNGICILAASEPEQWPKETNATLKKVIELTGNKFDDCLRLNSSEGNTVLELIRNKNVSHILVFDKTFPLQNFQFTIKPYQWVWVNEKAIYTTVDLFEFVENRNAKASLWKALQEEFETARNFNK